MASASANLAQDPPALRVLTDRALLRLMYSFVPSMEFELRAFEQSVRAKFYDPLRVDGLAAPFQWNGLLAQAAMFLGDRDMVDLLIHVNKCWRHINKPRTWTLEMAMHGGVRGGRLDLLDHFLAKLPDYRVDPDLLRVAAKHGDYSAMTWVYSHVPRRLLHVESYFLNDLAKEGRLEAIRWLHDHDFALGFSSRTLDLAAGSGSLELVQFLHENRSEGCSTEAMDRAATFGRLNVITFLHRHRGEGCTAQAMDGAAKNGHLEVVRFLHANRREGCTAAGLNYAATNGHFDVVRFLVERRNEGCLFEARNCSLLRGYADQAAYLSSQMRSDLTLCSVRMHTTEWKGPGRRQCQDRAPATIPDEDDAGVGSPRSSRWLKSWHSLLSRLHAT